MERYRREGKVFCIDLSFKDYGQLYDNRDPAPFIERDLDEDFVKYILMCMAEIPFKEPKKIVLKGPEIGGEIKAQKEFIEAFHLFFEHEVRALDNELKELLRLGRTSLIFGVTFLVVCLIIATKIIGDEILIYKIFREGLVIMGWVATWKPINIFLYEWWPHLGKRKVFKYLSTIKVEFR